MSELIAHGRQHQPAEISIQARLCNGARCHSIGDLLTYRSGLWMVKGFYFGIMPSGEREVYYILSEATRGAHKTQDEGGEDAHYRS